MARRAEGAEGGQTGKVTALGRHGAARARRNGPRRSWRFDAALTPRTEVRSMRKAERIEAPFRSRRNPSAPALAGEEA